MLRLISVGLVLALVALTAPAHAQVYVDKDAGGANDGSSWSDAYTDLQTAIDNASSSSEIWVAEGIYKPDSEGDSFTITGNKDGIEIYGGFEGTESSRSDREPQTHRTILSGDLNSDDTDPDGDGIIEDANSDDDVTPENLNGGENAHHVLVLNGGDWIGVDVNSNVTTATVIDGVVVTAGQADGSSFADEYGGGLFCDGGGSGNECSPLIRGVAFAGNAADFGGAIFNNGDGGTSSPQVTRATFTGNTAADLGGGIYSNTSNSGVSKPSITNAVFEDNVADAGGAIYNNGDGGTSSPSITNTTFTGNVVTNYGGAIYNNGNNGTSSPSIANAILWSNSAGIDGDEIYNDAANPTLSHTIIQGGLSGISGDNSSSTTDGGGNLDKDPQFVDASTPEGADGDFATTDDGLRLRGADYSTPSPAIDAGDNDEVGPSKDLLGQTRSYDGDGDGTATVDMGAYEYTSTPLPVELVTFDATSTEAGVRLTWQTASERNNAGFEVQRRDVDSWKSVGYVESKAEGGATTEALFYRYAAEDLSVGTHRFRLKQVDLDGSSTLTDPVSPRVRMQEALTLNAPAPNPVSNTATLSFAVKEQKETRITLYNTLGQRVATVYEGTPQPEEGRTVRFNTSNLPSGSYFLRLETGGKTKTEQFTVVR